MDNWTIMHCRSINCQLTTMKQLLSFIPDSRHIWKTTTISDTVADALLIQTPVWILYVRRRGKKTPTSGNLASNQADAGSITSVDRKRIDASQYFSHSRDRSQLRWHRQCLQGWNNTTGQSFTSKTVSKNHAQWGKSQLIQRMPANLNVDNTSFVYFIRRKHNQQLPTRLMPTNAASWIQPSKMLYNPP